MISTRPVEGIYLPLFSEHEYRELEALGQSWIPIQRLIILIVDVSTPNEHSPQLSAHLPHLEALHIVPLVQKYNLVCTKAGCGLRAVRVGGCIRDELL